MRGGLKHRIQYRLWRAVSWLVLRLSPRASYAAAAVIGSAAFFLWPRGRRATLSNFRRVLPTASKAEVRRVARLSLVNYCRYLADFVRFPFLDPEAIVRIVHGAESFAALDRALERGKGAIMVCMHFGNWDLGAGAAAARGYPITVVAETFGDPRLDDLVVGARRKLGMRVVKMEKAGPSLLRSLKHNGLLALLIDRPVPGDGIRVRFFGEEVEVPAGPARLALRSGATVVPTAIARLGPHSLDVETLTDFSLAFTPTGDEQRDILELTQTIMSSHERFIRDHPDQWYMFREMWPRCQRQKTTAR